MSLNETLRAVSDPIRREILELLKNGPMNAGDISSHFSITNAAISRHLSVLKKAELIRFTRNGQHIRYELNTSILEEIILWTSTLKGENHETEQNKKTLDHC